MSANQTRVSRIDAGDGDDADIASLLDALARPQARYFAACCGLSGSICPDRPLRHPDLEALVAIEHALDRIRAFLSSRSQILPSHGVRRRRAERWSGKGWASSRKYATARISADSGLYR